MGWEAPAPVETGRFRRNTIGVKLQEINERFQEHDKKLKCLEDKLGNRDVEFLIRQRNDHDKEIFGLQKLSGTYYKKYAVCGVKHCCSKVGAGLNKDCRNLGTYIKTGCEKLKNCFKECCTGFCDKVVDAGKGC